MRPLGLIVVTTLAIASTVGTGCAQHEPMTPIATRPSITVFPVQMPGGARKDIAEYIALMLERSNVEMIDVNPDVFPVDIDAPINVQADSFAAFVESHAISTDYALFAQVIGSPQRGVDAIHTIVVDGRGQIAWTDDQTPETRAMKRARPSDPMQCANFIVERLRGPFDLLDPGRADAPRGRWSTFWEKDSLAPDDAQLRAMADRLDRLVDEASTSTVLVYPPRSGDSWCDDCATRITDTINRKGLMRAKAATSPLPFTIEASGNEQRVLWSAARSIQQLVRAERPDYDYVLLADYLLQAPPNEARGVHMFVLDRAGEWVIVEHQNASFPDFRKIHPVSLQGCTELTILRLEHILDG